MHSAQPAPLTWAGLGFPMGADHMGSDHSRGLLESPLQGHSKMPTLGHPGIDWTPPPDRASSAPTPRAGISLIYAKEPPS